jgi:UPF0716 protein FxsA
MLRWVLALFILIPALELVLLIQTGKLIGAWATIALLILSGLFGAYMAKREGKRVWDYAQFKLAKGELPTDSILDGICIFIGGALLLLPGFLSDIAGLLLLLPLTRGIAKLLVLRYITKRIGQGKIILFRR